MSKPRPWLTMTIAAVLSAAVWALSPLLSGHREPWDADGPFYLIALAGAGFAAGLLTPRPLWAHYLGAVFGQAAYEAVFLPMGPLFVLGLVFVAGYSVVFVVAAGLTGRARTR